MLYIRDFSQTTLFIDNHQDTLLGIPSSVDTTLISSPVLDAAEKNTHYSAGAPERSLNIKYIQKNSDATNLRLEGLCGAHKKTATK
jgi:hypothetical protein